MSEPEPKVKVKVLRDMRHAGEILKKGTVSELPKRIVDTLTEGTSYELVDKPEQPPAAE